MLDGTARPPLPAAPDAETAPAPCTVVPDAPQGLAVVCTLAEGHYFCGVAALANSLVRAGFVGEIVVGYRGSLPGWLEALPVDAPGQLRVVTPAVSLRPVRLDGPWHMANLKPRFMVDIFETICPDTDLVYYFDPDIVIDCEWATLSRWTGEGVVMALDVSNTFMSPQHVYRRAWERLAAARGHVCRDVTGYVNSGCVGLSRRDAGFACLWAELMEVLAEERFDMTRLKYAGGQPEFAAMDQDVLNAAIMASRVPLALLGVESMGVFPRRGNVMPHAMFDKKPWVRPYIRDALRGHPPGRAHLAYWRFVDAPLRPFGPLELARKKLGVAIARAIGCLHVRDPRDL